MKNKLNKLVMIGLYKKVVVLFILALSSSLSGQVDRSIPEAGPAPVIEFKEPFTTKLSNNLTLMIVVNDKLPTASATLIIDNPPILESDKSGMKSLVTSNMGKGNKFQSKDEFIEEKDFMGSFISYNSSGGSFSSLSRYFERTMTMFAQGALYPIFSDEEFVKEKTKLTEALKIDEKNAASIARRVENIVAYKKGHPRSEYVTEASVASIEMTDIDNFYKSYFKPNNAYLVVIGDVNMDKTISLSKELFEGWQYSNELDKMFGEGSVNDFVDPEISEKTTIHVVDVPNSANVEISFQNIIDRKTSDADYFSGTVANRVLGAGPESRLFSVIREEKGYAYGAYSGLPTSSKSKTKFQARTTVRTEVADSAIVEMHNQLKIMRDDPITDEELSNVKSGYFGSFAMSMEESSTIANQALSIRSENLPTDFYKTFLSNLNKVSKDDVMDSSKKFFLIDNAQIVVTGKINDIIENLENIYLDNNKIDVIYHDEFGNITQRPDYSVSDDVTTESIINNYLDLIGGKDKLEEVKSIEIKGNANLNMQGQSLVLEFYSLKNNQNQSLATVTAGGMVVQKSVFNKYQGYNEVNGQKMPITDTELEQAIINSALFTELNYDYSTMELVGTSIVNEEKAYEVKVTDNKTEYYSIESGLKVKEVETSEVEGNQMSVETTINEYEEVDGILIPSEINLVTPGMPIPGGITIKFGTINLNIKTSDSDFN
ncbi:MAG: insulinase family protein [Cryomorphaceae bacterium]|jgi:predicted Zn-dependent peptidase|nr:insulinase family protein [Cryomorphaceae bacterium]MBT3688612.1 insulinase family protein [Cryomorphaceae bacterium]MBT4518075.1 insulinase family protein [Cryomorphaceae bacterium]MBT6546650.1 insulinase family protein [Cryomorphaceae bacterium]MBT6935568.1 insulinase family protein [Cryomorphaceae bacterium]